jgi:nicotinamidase/pyrazinamidase
MNSIIIVDVQNDFLPGGALPVRQGDEVVPVINRLMDRFNLIVATQDWHPADHGSFAANHAGKKPGDMMELAGLPQVLWPVHCVQETHGADFAPGLETGRIDCIFRNGTDPGVDSYSGFFDNGHRASTGLGAFLNEHQVRHVYVCGLATDYCVKFTVLDAIALGFRAHLIVDACRGVNLAPGDVPAAIEEMKTAGADILSSVEMSQESFGRPGTDSAETSHG